MRNTMPIVRFTMTAVLCGVLASCGAFSDERHAGGVLDETESTVTGKVSDPSGRPVSGARMLLRKAVDSLAAKPESWQDTTDSNGRYAFGNVAAGRYYMEATQRDSLGLLVSLQVSAHDSMARDLSIAPESKLRWTWSASQADSVWCPQLSRILTAADTVLLIPSGQYQFQAIVSGKLAGTAIPGQDSVTVAPASLLKVDSAGAISQQKLGNKLDTIALQPGPGVAFDTYITFAFDPATGTRSLGSMGNTNSGKKPCWGCGTYDPNTVSRILIRFALPDSFSAQDSIVSAKLTLVPTSWINKNVHDSFPMQVHKILKAWKAGNGTAACLGAPADMNSAAIDGATALERYWTADTSARWSQLGLATDGSDASSSIYSTVKMANQSLQPIAWDITALANEWLQAPAGNFGMLIRNPGDVSTTYLDYPMFNAGEAAVPADRPRLDLVVRKSIR